MNNLENYFSQKGWEFKLGKGEYCLDQCPLSGCGPNHFYISAEKETFYCQKCGEKGNLLSLKKRLGDIPPIAHVSDYYKLTKYQKVIDASLVEKYHKELLENPTALAYLKEQRGYHH